ncbi:hypothetical protein Mmc1_2874 [Magnetococcus marinus MC-1]|uniref:Uncharacterized protein n=1 Tax=Magnetococcus marinus (strain ATCC BAA-1437 / JCM 17883 / MC-1) TaxID=156889 RepID=A0LBM2_MAGMM|nr:hypothetical protein Mmc1_2874 [Magnetococcus marinus MC-1]
MSHPVHDLRHLIASKRSVSGRVVAVTGGMVRVATARGVVQVMGRDLAVGDRVLVENGITRPVSQSTQQVTHKV